MKKFLELLENIKTRPIKISVTASGVEQVQQTQRNALKAEMLNTLAECLAEILPLTARTKEGILIEVPCDAVADGIADNSTGSGAITVALDLKIKDLETDLEYESKEYARDVAEKARAKAEAEAKKARKIARDTATRKKRKAEEEGE